MSQKKYVRKIVRNTRYYSYADTAALAESEGLYDKAQNLWLQASKVAKKRVNADWSEHRSQYCLSVLRNEWS